MPMNPSEVPWPALRRAARTVVVVDVVESVRLMEQDEDDIVRRWQLFVGEVVTRLLPRSGGRLVKSLGDGLMLEFGSVPPAIQCALAMQQAIQLGNQSRPQPEWMCLRIGAHVADVIVDDHDIYGSGVNLAARLATLAGPGEIVVSAAVRGGLTDGLDGDIADLGDCFVKHVRQPVRAYRVGAMGSDPAVRISPPATEASRPVLAVIPFTAARSDPSGAVIGEALADDLISALSRTSEMHVVSRLSTTALRGRGLTLSELKALLGASYVLSGSYVVNGRKLRLRLELAETRQQHIVWADGLSGQLDEFLQPDGDIISLVVSSVSSAVTANEIARSVARSMPSLESHTLLLGSVALMHGASSDDFDRAKAMLDHLIERHPREPGPRAWMGKWHVMRFIQGVSRDRTAEARLARESVARALDLSPKHSMALAIDGLVSALLMRDLVRAQASYSAALEANPNESLAWLFSSALHFYRGEGAEAAHAAEHALRLSPLDPLKYYYDTFAATAMLAAGRHGQAIELAHRSLKANSQHTATYRTLAIAQVLDGQIEEGTKTMNRMRQLEPELTVSAYLDRFPGTDRAMALRYAEAMRTAGLPA